MKILKIGSLCLVLFCAALLLTSCKNKESEKVSGNDVSVTSGETLKFEPFSEEKLASLKGEPVVVMFWADWCPDCVHIKKVSFSDPRVITAAKDINLLEVDCTDKEDKEIKALQEKYGGDCVPTFIFFNKDGEIEKNWKLVEPRTADELIFRFEKYNKKK